MSIARTSEYRKRTIIDNITLLNDDSLKKDKANPLEIIEIKEDDMINIVKAKPKAEPAPEPS